MKPLAIVAACILTMVIPEGAAGTASSAAATWIVSAGGDPPDHGIQAQDYFPRTITVHAGDTITWTVASVSEHTVTFLSGIEKPKLIMRRQDGTPDFFNPLLANLQGGNTYDGTGLANSGLLQQKGSWTLRFTKPGRYTYACMLHYPGMTGTVIVLPQGASLPMTQVQYDRLAAGRLASQLAFGAKLRASTTATKNTDANGTTVHTFRLVGDADARVSVIAFNPLSLAVKAGDTVKWVMTDPFELHTITFIGQEQVPAFAVSQPQSQGPPRLYFDPKGAVPTGGAVHSANAYYNSGYLLSPREYTLKFTKPGTYTYWCLRHVPEGMRGTIAVE